MDGPGKAKRSRVLSLWGIPQRRGIMEIPLRALEIGDAWLRPAHHRGAHPMLWHRPSLPRC